jgi:hypothetical protein
MSLKLAVWHSEKAISEKEAAGVYQKLYEQQRVPIEQHVDVYAFYNELTARYPDLDMVADEDIDASPWASSLDRSGFHVIMFMLEQRADEVVPVVLELTEKYGLVCFDPQTKKVHLPSHLGPVAAGPKGSGSLHIIRTDDGEPPPEYQVGFEEYGVSHGPIKMAQVQGDEDLVDFLTTDIGIESAKADSVLQELRAKGQARIPNLVLSDGDLIILGLR